MDEVSLGIYIPSYRRAATCVTHKFLEHYQYVVRKSEEAAYRAAGIEHILAVDDDKINGMAKVNQWLIDNAPEEIICILDDDITRMLYRLDTSEDITDPETVTAEIERFAQVMLDLRIGFGSVDATCRPYCYDAEFAFKGCAGAIRWINRPVFKARCNEAFEFNYDLDVILQELMVNRVILKSKHLCALGLTDTNEGGASDKQRKAQIATVELMKAKWGRYFQYNFRTNVPMISVKR